MLEAKAVVDNQPVKTAGAATFPLESPERALIRAQSVLDALKVRLKQATDDRYLVESPVRILTRAVAPPE